MDLVQPVYNMLGRVLSAVTAQLVRSGRIICTRYMQSVNNVHHSVLHAVRAQRVNLQRSPCTASSCCQGKTHAVTFHEEMTKFISSRQSGQIVFGNTRVSYIQHALLRTAPNISRCCQVCQGAAVAFRLLCMHDLHSVPHHLSMHQVHSGHGVCMVHAPSGAGRGVQYVHRMQSAGRTVISSRSRPE
jgi:hypothetical protein